MGKMLIRYTKKETKKGVYAKIMVFDVFETLDNYYKTELVKPELFKSVVEREVAKIKASYNKSKIKQLYMPIDEFDKYYKDEMRIKNYAESIFDNSDFIDRCYEQYEKDAKN